MHVIKNIEIYLSSNEMYYYTYKVVNELGVVEEINLEKSKVRVLVSMFGRETPVELEFSQIQKVD